MLPTEKLETSHDWGNSSIQKSEEWGGPWSGTIDDGQDDSLSSSGVGLCPVNGAETSRKSAAHIGSTTEGAGGLIEIGSPKVALRPTNIFRINSECR